MSFSKSVKFLRDTFLGWDPSQEPAKVIHAEGVEKGHDHFRIYTQTREQKEFGIAMLHRIYSEEVEAPGPATAPAPKQDGGA